MKILLNWLKEFVEIDGKAADIAERLTMSGIETHAVKSAVVDPDIVIVKISSIEKHPNADKLSLCDVTDGTTDYRIVCGAPNIKVGDVVPFAKLGAKLGDITIKKAKIRGYESNGMLCSEKELCAGDDASGIMMLPKDTKLGITLNEYLSSTAAIETEVTINRGDCLSVLGIARELSAIYSIPLKKNIKNYSIKSANVFPVEVKNTKDCVRYVGRVIKNLKVGSSPQWLVARLETSGLHPVNTVVDITNYILLEYGQPLHAFDADKISGKIIVRNALKGEKIHALDNNEYALEDDMLVIADEKCPVAVAGVIGGVPTSVTESTKNIFLEAASFDPISIRKTSKELLISTDSSYRFIRGIDTGNILNISEIACQMIKEICGGEMTAGAVDIWPGLPQRTEIILDSKRVNRVLGSQISDYDIKNILFRLGFEIITPPSDGKIKVKIPSYRNDVKREIDMIEEIARIYGYNGIKTPARISFSVQIQKNEMDDFAGQVREAAISLGFSETVSYNFVEKDDIKKLYIPDALWKISNPVASDESYLAPTLIPVIIKNVMRNINKGNGNVRIFEIGKGFEACERMLFAGCGTGSVDVWWKDSAKSFDFYLLKGFLESIFRELGIKNWVLEKTGLKMFHPGRSAKIVINSKEIGSFGLLHPAVAESFGVKNRELYIFEINLDELMAFSDSSKKYSPVPRFPYVERDISIEAADKIAAYEIQNTVKKIGGDVLSEVMLLDLYTGEQVKKGHISLTFRLRFQLMDRTLRDDEVNEAVKKIVSELGSRFSASVR